MLGALKKHHHPGSPVAASAGDRLPSPEDYGNLMAPQYHDVKPEKVSSMITWYDEEMRMHYTTFGMDPDRVDRFWVRYTGPDGSVRMKTFVHDPSTAAGKPEYERWFKSAESEFLGPATVRPQ